MYNIEYLKWAGSGQERKWGHWRGPFVSKTHAEENLQSQKEMWPNDEFRIVEVNNG